MKTNNIPLNNLPTENMPSLNFCEECEIEFKIKHDADTDIYKAKHCPFCGVVLDIDEQYDFENEDEDEEQ